MIRVLIVDDDKLVRKGLISFMPWSDYGMEVVGEASNGENALKFVAAHPVDLLITDLAMPVMSGIELMREVRSRYPGIQTVVLSLHQDFEYAQEAIRLGAIDYIAKVELESEQFDQVLGRIARILGQKQKAQSVVLPAPEDDLENVDELLVLYALKYAEETVLPAPLESMADEIEAGIWCLRNACGPIQAIQPIPNCALVLFQGLLPYDRKSIVRLMRIYRKNELFYDYTPHVPYVEIQSGEVLQRGQRESSIPLEELKRKWLSTGWIYDDDLFASMLEEMKQLRLPPIRLARLFYSLVDEWNRMFLPITPHGIAIDDFFPVWVQLADWLSNMREAIRHAGARASHSDEIRSSILKAMTIAGERIDQPITAAEMARMVNMSSSYFSQCFKDIVGKTYSDYIRDVRLEKAKQYLSHTTKTIQWISEQVGYVDVKYFSRLFREQVGMLPSEYRQHSESRH